MADFSDLADDFLTLDTAIWTPSGSVSANGDLKIQPNGTGWTNSIISKDYWKLAPVQGSGPHGFVEFVPSAAHSGNGVCDWLLTNASGTQGIIISQDTATTYRVSILDGIGTTNALGYTTTDPFWRVCTDDTNLTVFYTQSSPDAVTWTFRKTYSATDMPNFTFQHGGVPEFFMRFRLYGGSGSTQLPAFRRIGNPVAKTSVTAVVATASALAPVPVLRQSVNLTGPATAAVAAPAPSLKVSVDVAVALVLAAAVAPTLNLPVPVTISPPVMTASLQAIAPDLELSPNTIVEASVMAATVIMLAPGDYVRMSAPPAAASALLLPPLRVGVALSRFAATVVQTPRNWGGAAVYYRVNDPTTTLTDTLGLHHGAWSGTQNLVTGAVAADSDKAMEFDGTSTVAYNGLMPDYRPFRDTGQGGLEFMWRADEWPRMWGWSAMVVFRTLPGATKELYILSRGTTGLGVPAYDQTLKISQGRLISRWYHDSDWLEMAAGPLVNDGGWHMAVMTVGSVMDDPNPNARCRLYLDGVLQGVLNFASPVSTRPLTVGGAVGVPSMEGALDEYAEFDYAVSQWEVKELWNQLNNLTGPGLHLDVPPAYVTASAPAPTIRRSPVHPLNEFYDDFSAPFIDRSKWRDASPTARVIDGSAVLRASGEQLLTADYFQTRDSSFIVRIMGLPLREGDLFLGLVNEYDIVPDAIFGGINQFDSLRRHRTIGFDIYRTTISGRTTTTLTFVCQGQSFTGPQIYQSSIPFIPDDPNYPSPHRWLRLDIDPGIHGGATWFTSPDGVNWTHQYDVHGGKANTVTTLVPNAITGVLESQTTVTYEDVGNFYLFDRDEATVANAELTTWQGHMRVKINTEQGNVAVTAAIDNVNTHPQGTGTPVDILAKPALVRTSTSTEYLLYALQPRIYSSAQDVSIEVPAPASASVRFLTPPEPVYVFTPVLSAAATMYAPERAGDALPVAIPAIPATAEAHAVTPDRAGVAQNYYAEPNQAQAYFAAYPPVVDTTQSSPAPVVGPARRVITLKTRNVRVLVTQN